GGVGRRAVDHVVERAAAALVAGAGQYRHGESVRPVADLEVVALVVGRVLVAGPRGDGRPRRRQEQRAVARREGARGAGLAGVVGEDLQREGVRVGAAENRLADVEHVGVADHVAIAVILGAPIFVDDFERERIGLRGTAQRYYR